MLSSSEMSAGSMSAGSGLPPWNLGVCLLRLAGQSHTGLGEDSQPTKQAEMGMNSFWKGGAFGEHPPSRAGSRVGTSQRESCLGDRLCYLGRDT